MPAADFAPWRRQQRRARLQLLCACLCAAVALVLPAWLGRPYLMASLPLLLAAWLLLGRAGANRRAAAARRHGKQLEQVAAGRAVQWLGAHGLAVEAGRRVRGLGDVDLLVWSGERLATVEIKSFQRWRQARGDRRRERLATEQCVRQRDALAADAALLWLPDARPSLWQRLWGYSFAGQGVALVRGDEKRLLRALRRKL